jgi:hypothetical protein
LNETCADYLNSQMPPGRGRDESRSPTEVMRQSHRVGWAQGHRSGKARVRLHDVASCIESNCPDRTVTAWAATSELKPRREIEASVISIRIGCQLLVKTVIQEPVQLGVGARANSQNQHHREPNRAEHQAVRQRPGPPPATVGIKPALGGIVEVKRWELGLGGLGG